MRPELQALIPEVAFGFLTQLVIVWALVTWGRWVAARRGSGLWWRRAARGPLAAFGLGAIGVAISSVMLVGAFEAISSADPSQKANAVPPGCRLRLRHGSRSVGRAGLETSSRLGRSGWWVNRV